MDLLNSNKKWIATAPLMGMLACAVFTLPQRASGQEVRRLQSDLESILGSFQSRGATWGVLVTSMDQGDTLFAVGPDSALAPASNLKLLTTAAALRELGPEFRFQTFLLTEGVVENGVLHGDLVVYGTGDPGISDRFYFEKDGVFHLLVDQLSEVGIHSITGDLIADASHLPGLLRPDGWDAADLNDHFAAGISALSYNENVVSFRVVAAGRGGEPPEIHTVPPNAGLDVENVAETVAGSARPRLAILREDPLEAIRIQGRITRGSRDVWRQMTVPRPAHFAASAFLAVLDERGIQLGGGIEVINDPTESIVGRLNVPSDADRRRTRILARHTSPALREYLAVINKRSNNLFAELVFRTLGRVRDGLRSPNSSEQAVKESLANIGVPVDDLVLLDGSGLSAGNRVSPGAFVGLFDGMARSPEWPEYWETLPEAGQRRGLPRMYRTAAAGNLRAKTGTIEGVSALSGMVRSQDEERLAFSILLNGARSTTAAKRVENLIGARLAEFARGQGRVPATIVVDVPVAPQAQADDTGRYQVRNGENLTFIARRYSLTIDDVLRANPRLEPNRIYAGQWLIIPQRSGGGSQ